VSVPSSQASRYEVRLRYVCKRFGLKDSVGLWGWEQLEKTGCGDHSLHNRGPGYFSSQIIHIHTAVSLHTYSPMKMEHTQRSETFTFKLQTLGNNLEERYDIQNSLKSRTCNEFCAGIIAVCCAAIRRHGSVNVSTNSPHRRGSHR
jgi:hypothetical protein